MYDKVMSSISHIFIRNISYHLLVANIFFTYLALIRGVFIRTMYEVDRQKFNIIQVIQ